ncbi:hypothetical protein wcw_0458 [Waddlia chondrophila WSU 86-1044]|uniref:Uncharacterized protein n=1 Tax=Waddlia chondrophila (strain ATCC VR-1470 / WSU 86-1044) TaxID=716544 RepID=D6YUL9_WADCW|nr:hypothetical protein wcw_0458 [Waddlia chondrophila WSU 86-1044]
MAVELRVLGDPPEEIGSAGRPARYLTAKTTSSKKRSSTP